jgi:hypothetical protein
VAALPSRLYLDVVAGEPVDQLETEGYGSYRELFQASENTMKK